MLGNTKETNLPRLCARIHQAGWLTSFEVLEPFLAVGLPAGKLLLHQYDRAFLTYSKVVRSAFLPGATNNAYLRRWWRASGALSAYLALLADLGIEPRLGEVGWVMSTPDSATALVIGACLSQWRGISNPAAAMPVVDGDDEPTLLSFQWANLVFLALERERWLAYLGDDAPRSMENEYVEGMYESARKEIHQRQILGLPTDPLADFTFDLARLARGGKPDWGDDNLDDLSEAPPFLLRHLCRPDGELTMEALQHLVRRIMAVDTCLTSCLFPTRAEQKTWQKRLGYLDKPSRGDFRIPWIKYPEKPNLRSNLPGRNEPCLCGSGRKFKKCCLSKYQD